MIVLASLALGALGALVTFVAVALWPWRVEATLKATSGPSAVSLAGGLEVAGLSGSAAAILGGPGVVAVHLRGRELLRRSIAHVSVESVLDRLEQPADPRTSTMSRLAQRAKDALLARTDLAELPELGLRVLLDLRQVSLHGALLCGFADPAITGKAAAWLYPIAGALAPLGTLDVTFDWTGRTVLDGEVELSFRIVPARVAIEGLRFARRNVHLRRKGATTSSTMAASSTT